LRSAEPVLTQLRVEIWAPGGPVHNHKLGDPAFSYGSHTGREDFATGPDKVRWRDYSGTYLRHAEGGQAEVLIGQRTFRVVVGELQPA